MAQTVKRLSTMQETWVLSLGREDSLEKEMATHSSEPQSAPSLVFADCMELLHLWLQRI